MFIVWSVRVSVLTWRLDLRKCICMYVIDVLLCRRFLLTGDRLLPIDQYVHKELLVAFESPPIIDQELHPYLELAFNLATRNILDDPNHNYPT
jgi:hypothetical protein